MNRALKAVVDAAAGRLTTVLLKALRLASRQRTADLAGAVMRRIGPLIPEHRIGRANLAAAYPEKSADEIEEILRGVWDNLGRVAAEFAHLDRIRTYDAARPERADVFYEQVMFDRFHRLRLDGKPALVFAAHLGNWELPAKIAADYKLDATVLYRRPNLRAVDEAVRAIRAGTMGTLMPTSLDAPVKLADALAAGGHVAMLVDQYYVRGVDVTFFGRRTKANPLIARLARQIECPIHGTRVIRQPDGTFIGEVTEAIEPVRDAAGRVDIAGTMQVITDVVEAWVREHPEQWLWLHRRWR